VLFHALGAWRIAPGFHDLLWNPAFVMRAAQLLDGSVRFWHDQIFYKPGPDEKSVIGWHVDGDYWFTCTSQQMLTAWIPLVDCPPELGPLVVADGSHKWSHKLDRSLYAFHRGNDGLAAAVQDLGYEFKPVTMNMKRGEFSFHHCRAIHGSHPNRGSRPRIAAAVHLQDERNSYRASIAPNGRKEQYNDMICRRTASGEPEHWLLVDAPAHGAKDGPRAHESEAEGERASEPGAEQRRRVDIPGPAAQGVEQSPVPDVGAIAPPPTGA